MLPLFGLTASHFFASVPLLPVGFGTSDDGLVGRAAVIDGDTLEIRGRRVRLHGIDAPESDQPCRRANGRSWPCGSDAASALAERVGAREIRCEPQDVDRHGRIVAVCFKDGEDLNAWLVANGWAVAYRRYSQAYVGEEQAAEAARDGIWSGDLVPPEDWRRGMR